MKRLAWLATGSAAAFALAACGHGGTSQSSRQSTDAAPTVGTQTAGTHTAGTTAAATTAEYARVDRDKDNDAEAPADDKTNAQALNFGHEATEPERRAIVALVKRYYAIALAGNGARACTMIYSTLAESVPEDYGSNEPPGPPYMKGATCPVVLDGMFKYFHAQLAVEVPLLRVTHVRLLQHQGTALLSFGDLPEREILVKRESHTWRMDALLDRELL